MKLSRQLGLTASGILTVALLGGCGDLPPDPPGSTTNEQSIAQENAALTAAEGSSATEAPSTTEATDIGVADVPGPCYATGDFSFKDQKINNHTYAVLVFNSRNCTGGEIARGTVSSVLLGDDRYVTMNAADFTCDNIGITVFVHGFSRGTTGCGHSEGKSVRYDLIGRPKNFWINVKKVNSHVLNIPPP